MKFVGMAPRPGRGVCLSLLSVVALAVIAGPIRAEVVNRIVATIDGEPVTLVELEAFGDQVRRRPGAAAAPMSQRELLDELVLEKIIKKQVEAQGLVATEQQVDSYITSIRERNQLTEPQLREALEQQGLTWEQYREQVRTDIERASLINREIRTKVNVSPEEIERYYKAHPEEFGGAVASDGSRMRVRMISRLVPKDATAEQRAAVRSEIERIRKEAVDGKDFAALAKQHSEGPGAADGGDLGDIEPGQMQDEFARAVAKLKPGEVSDVVETSTGYHILEIDKRESKASPKSDGPSPEVTEAIREKLYRDAIEERYDRWLKQDLRARYHVEILL